MKSKLQVQWCSLPVAAEALGMTPGALRKIVERNAHRGQDGVEAQVNGVRARKLGRLWRVSLSSAWSETIHSNPKSVVASPSSQNGRDDRDGDRS